MRETATWSSRLELSRNAASKVALSGMLQAMPGEQSKFNATRLNQQHTYLGLTVHSKASTCDKRNFCRSSPSRFGWPKYRL